MENKKILYGVLTIAVILTITGINFGLKGSLFVDKRIIAMQESSATASIQKDAALIKNDLKNKEKIINCDVVIVGASAGGTSAAIASAREGATTCLVEETNGIGGMLTNAGVSAIDGRPDTPSGIFREFTQRVEEYYTQLGQNDQIHNCTISYLCFEPSVGDRILKEMAAEENNLTIFYNSKVNKVYREGDKILGINITQNNNKTYVINARITIDGTEFGDLMYSANVPYDLGIDKDSKEFLTEDAEQCIQPLTYVAILKKDSKPSIPVKPENYDRENFKCVVKSPLCPDSPSKFDINRLLSYGRMPNDKLMINIPSHSYGNDFHATTPNLESFSREEILEEAKNYSKGFIYFLQTEMGFEYFDIYDEFGTADKFAKIPYVRESRRLRGVKRLSESDVIKGNGDQRSDVSKEVIAIGDYPIDLHFCTYGVGDIFKTIAPYQIPYGVTVPEKINGFMVVDKNISVSHIVNGTTRLQPVVMSVGQAVGIASAMASKQGIEPRDINIKELQKKILEAKGNLFYFKDLDVSHYAYPYAANLAVKEVISGYSDFTFKPNSPINEADLLKILKTYIAVENKDLSLISNIGLSENSTKLVKRADMAKYIYNIFSNANKIDASNIKILKFYDVKINTDLYNKLSQLAAIEIVNGDNKAFKPNDNLTRADAVVLLGKTFDHLFTE